MPPAVADTPTSPDHQRQLLKLATAVVIPGADNLKYSNSDMTDTAGRSSTCPAGKAQGRHLFLQNILTPARRILPVLAKKNHAFM